MNAIDEQIAEAKATADKAQQENPIQTTSTNTALSDPNSAAAPDMSLSSFLNSGGLQPDLWLSVKDTGLKLDKNEKKVIESFTAQIDFSKIKLFSGSRGELPGSQATYIKTYDGKAEARSNKPWAVAVAELKAESIKEVIDYRGADILFELSEDVQQGSTTVPAGKKIGYTTSVTNFSIFMNFLKEMIAAGEVELNDAAQTFSGTVKVMVTHSEKTGNGNTWGILGYELVK